MMTAKQERFVAEYLKDLNATQAAIRAGYSEKAAEQQGYENLRKPEIAAAIVAGKRRQLREAELCAIRVLEEARRIGFVDVRSFYDDRGNPRPVSEWTAEQAAAVAGIETIIKNAGAGDGTTDRIHKLRFWDKVRALELLMKHFGLLVDRIEVSGELTVIPARLQAARKRLAAWRAAESHRTPRATQAVYAVLPPPRPDAIGGQGNGRQQ